MTEPATTSPTFDALLSCVECGGTSLERISDRFRCGDCGSDYEIIDGVASFFRKEAPVSGQDNDRMEFWNQGWSDAGSPFGTVDRHTEGEWQTDGRENQHTRSYTRAEFRTLIEQAGFNVTRIEQSQLQLGDIPVLGRILAPFLSSKALRKCIGPFGMMLIADCRPNDK